MSVNKTIIQGRLVRDPELRRTQSGTAVASFTVAWSEKHKETERKLFLPCVAWKNSAEFVANYFSKGSEIVVEGSLTSRQWQDKTGNNRETVELVVDCLHFCGPKRDSQPTAYTGRPSAAADYSVMEDDGDLPF
jgi:single-strand DNA-binding protein